MSINKQPVFTATPILAISSFDPPIPSSMDNPNNLLQIYEDNSSYGTLITRITINSLPNSGSAVTEKVLYLYIDGSKIVLYKSALMSGTPSADIPPSVVFTFGSGLITLPGYELRIGASIDANSTGETGDFISVVVEGGTYDQPQQP